MFAIVVLSLGLFVAGTGTIVGIIDCIRSRFQVDVLLVALFATSSAAFCLAALAEKSFLATGNIYLVLYLYMKDSLINV